MKKFFALSALLSIGVLITKSTFSVCPYAQQAAAPTQQATVAAPSTETEEEETEEEETETESSETETE